MITICTYLPSCLLPVLGDHKPLGVYRVFYSLFLWTLNSKDLKHANNDRLPPFPFSNKVLLPWTIGYHRRSRTTFQRGDSHTLLSHWWATNGEHNLNLDSALKSITLIPPNYFSALGFNCVQIIWWWSNILLKILYSLNSTRTSG